MGGFKVLVSGTVVVMLSACATGVESSLYSRELDALRADCTARDGLLVSAPGPGNGTPATDYVCQIRGGGSRLDR